MKEKEEKLLEILFEIFVEELIQDGELIDCHGKVNCERLEFVSKKLGLSDSQTFYSAILLCCGRISQTPITRSIDREEEKKIWITVIKSVIKHNRGAALACYQKNAKIIRKEVKAKGLTVSQKDFNSFILPFYLEVVKEVLV